MPLIARTVSEEERARIRTSAPARTKSRKPHRHVSTTAVLFDEETSVKSRLHALARAVIDHCAPHYANSVAIFFATALSRCHDWPNSETDRL